MRRRKKKSYFIYTFLLIFSVLTILVTIHIRKNISFLAEAKSPQKLEESFENNVQENEVSEIGEFNATTETSTLNPSSTLIPNISNTPSSALTPNNTSAPSTTLIPTKPAIDENKTALANNVSTIEKKKQYTVIIDPGHGGPDPGSSGKKGTEEKKITLAVALKLGPILEKSGYKVIYTRKTDNIQWSGQKEELLERAAIANNAQADLFVSIHTNSSTINNVNGTETYYNSSSSKGKKAAQYIQNEVIKQVKLKNRGIKTEDYSVLRNVSAPSVLIELAYISTPSEETILNSSDYQNKFAQGIASGVNKYFGK